MHTIDDNQVVNVLAEETPVIACGGFGARGRPPSAMVEGRPLWTADVRLAAAAEELCLAYVTSRP
jgi:hypothetical protein